MEDGYPPLETPNDLKLWEKLAEEQSALFHKTITNNEELRRRVDELERELTVWKLGFKAAEDEKLNLQKSMKRLEKNIGSLKDDNPLLLCLIDGDGNIFSPDLISSGHMGGRQAAMLLTKGFTDFMASDNAGSPGRGQVWLTVYCNKSGLMETLISNNICSIEEFEAFVVGFNQASPLFSIVDVGIGKEAADAKIKECLRVFTRFPQTSRVFFGGTHDNGYTSTLNYLENEGLLEKVVLLRGYKNLAVELRNLDLPELEIEGVFMSKKLPTNIFKKAPISPPGILPEDFERFRTPFKSPRAPQRSLSPAKNMNPLKYLDPSLPLNKQTPRPCTFHYLSICKQGDKCNYGHDYYLTPENFAELRANAKKSPCPAVNKSMYVGFSSYGC
ncbi:hypothetical protein BV22DRAFT_1077661 [Leucogyrophana mollusca]|uniref:Uncharacterized protein n=1 Tax=Leucogyrophana mollusca TaxID=85980 RepID=A0ACB8BZ61_9AGAM|nr:hypothetical protein BV22DRAFT_1077661 [Leucogyrophana mollusca]